MRQDVNVVSHTLDSHLYLPFLVLTGESIEAIRGRVGSGGGLGRKGGVFGVQHLFVGVNIDHG